MGFLLEGFGHTSASSRPPRRERREPSGGSFGCHRDATLPGAESAASAERRCEPPRGRAALVVVVLVVVVAVLVVLVVVVVVVVVVVLVVVVILLVEFQFLMGSRIYDDYFSFFP